MTAQILHLADFRPSHHLSSAQSGPAHSDNDVPPQPSPPASAARPPAPPLLTSAVAGGDVHGWGLPDGVTAATPALAPSQTTHKHTGLGGMGGGEGRPGPSQKLPRLLTIGDRVIFDRGRSQITEGVIIHLNPARAIVSVRITDGRDRGHVVARASHEVHLIDTGNATRLRTG